MDTFANPLETFQNSNARIHDRTVQKIMDSLNSDSGMHKKLFRVIMNSVSKLELEFDPERLRASIPAARRALLRMAEEELSHGRTLLAAHYLMTGKCYQPPAAAGQEPPLPWCQLLRELYHEETCGGAAYAQAAEDTEDVCLRELFQRLSRAEYGHAAMLLHLLENCLTSGNNLLK